MKSDEERIDITQLNSPSAKGKTVPTKRTGKDIMPLAQAIITAAASRKVKMTMDEAILAAVNSLKLGTDPLKPQPDGPNTAPKTAPAVPALNLAQADLPTFAGRVSEKSAEAWLRDLEHAFRPYGKTLSDEMKLALASRCIREGTPAGKWYDAYIRQNRDFPSWNYFIQEVTEMFGEVDQSVEATQQLRELSHSLCEGGVIEYATSFELIRSHTKMNEASARDWFISGLDGEIRQRVKDAKPDSLQKAIKIAREKEAAYLLRAGKKPDVVHNVNSYKRGNGRNYRGNRQRNRGGKYQKWNSNRGQRHNRKKGVECHCCHLRGHY